MSSSKLTRVNTSLLCDAMDSAWRFFIQYFMCIVPTILMTRAASETYLVTFPSNDIVNINCTEGQLISIEDIQIEEDNTQCGNRENCTISYYTIESIQRKCSDQHSCKIDVHSDPCFRSWIYYNLTYTCDATSDTSGNFDTLSEWTISGGSNNFEWKRCTSMKKCSLGIDVSSSTSGFAYIKDNSQGAGIKSALLTSPKIMPSNVHCMSFWYYISNMNGLLNLNMNTSSYSENLWSTSNTTPGVWYEKHINIIFPAEYTLVFKIEKSELNGLVAVGDIHISNKECAGMIKNELTCTCIEATQTVHLQTCPKYQFNFSFKAETEKCAGINIPIIDLFKSQCESQQNLTSCLVDLNGAFDAYQDCFPKKILKLEYSCTDKPAIENTQHTSDFSQTTEKPVIENTHHTSDFSQTTENTQDTSDFSQTTDLFAPTVSTTDGEPNIAAQSAYTTNTIGIIVGVVFGIAFIVGLVVLMFYFIKRTKSFRKSSASADNKIWSNDYTGHQAISLPTLSNPMSNNDGYVEIQTQNVNYQDINSHRKTSINASGRNYAKLDPTKNMSDNKDAGCVSNQDYVYIDETEAESMHMSINFPNVNTCTLNEEIHKNNQYAVIDPNNEHSGEIEKPITYATPPLGNYAILDPNETGFFRSKGNNKTMTEYALAVPINDIEGISDLQNPYSVSENGTYDSTGKVRNMEAETNIYSHSVENVYDTSSHERKIVENDGTYDHFFGDETEDNYNITKRE